MVNLKRILRAHKDAGALHTLFAPQRFVDDRVFLTKGNHVGVVLEVEGVDPECLTDETLESYTRRAATAWRAFDERFRIYQYMVKGDSTFFQRRNYNNQVVEQTVHNRGEFLAAKPEDLYSVRLFYSVLFEPSAVSRGSGFSNRKALRVLATELQRHRDTLVGAVEAFRRSLVDLLGLTILSKAETFAFLRLLSNLDPKIAEAERLKHDTHVDWYLPSLPLTCMRDGIRIGEAAVELLSLREPPASTFPDVLRDLTALDTNFILCTEFKRVPNENAVANIRAAQNHFHWSQ